MKKIVIYISLIFIVWLPGTYDQYAYSATMDTGDYSPDGNMPGTYRSHDEIIGMFRKLCDKFPGLSTFKSLGKTTENNDIWAFSFGNPEGGRIIIDGCLHGWEDMGSEVAYIWIKWLLESDDPVAKRILGENCWTVIPVINYDTYDRGNKNHKVCSGGVDLNRNFVRNWEYVPECKGDWGTSHGEFAGSEKETQVIREFLESNKPDSERKSVYLNTHYGGGPWIHYDGTDVEEFYIPLRNRTIELWNLNGIILKNISLTQYLPLNSRSASKGGLAGDASTFGFKAFTVEMLNQNCINGHKFAPIDDTCTVGAKSSRDPSYEKMEKELYPVFKQFFIAVSESVAIFQKRQSH